MSLWAESRAVFSRAPRSADAPASRHATALSQLAAGVANEAGDVDGTERFAEHGHEVAREIGMSGDMAQNSIDSMERLECRR